MPDFLKAPLVDAGPIVTPLELLTRLVLAFAFGWIVAWVYRRTRSANELDPSIPPTLLLLCILIAMVTQVIGGNTARAFSLVGTLSIVRFRTVVHDTQDTAFVIFAVVIGMAVGANQLWMAGLGIPIVGGAAYLMRAKLRAMPIGQAPFLLNVRLGLGQDVDAILGGTLKAHTSAHRLMAMSTAKQGSAIEATYEVHIDKDKSAEDLVKQLNQVEGVQHVELERPGADDDD